MICKILSEKGVRRCRRERARETERERVVERRRVEVEFLFPRSLSVFDVGSPHSSSLSEAEFLLFPAPTRFTQHAHCVRIRICS